MILTDDQRRIVESDDDHILVLAGAGCGKTTTLVSYVKERIGGRGDPRTIVLTFSNKAAEDVREKLSEAIPEYESRMFVGTIHEFCYDMIRRYGTNIGLDPEMRVFDSYDDRLRIFTDAVRRIPAIHRKLQGSDEIETDRAIRKQFDRMGVLKRSLDTCGDDMRAVYEEYDQTLRSMGAMDYDDILLYAYRIITELTEVSELYSTYYGLICVDESQDLDEAQYAVIKALADGTMRTLFVGDPNQSIYGFSGASSRYMCERYPEDFDVRRYRLRDNFRSSRAVIEAARRIEPDFEPEGHVALEGEFAIEGYDDQESEARAVVETMVSLMEAGHRDIGPRVKPEEICVIARNRYVLDPVAKVLGERGIDFTLKVGHSGPEFTTDLFRGMWNGMRVMTNRRDTLHLRELNSILGLPQDDALDMEAVAGMSETGRVLAEVWRLMEANDRKGTFDMTAVNGLIRDHVESAGDDFNLSRDMEEWEAVLDRYTSSTMRGRRSLAGLLSASSLRKVGPVRESGVILSTVHMSKGLEYDAVFIIGVNKGVFPDYRARTEAQREEERHDMFVAVTRAKRICHVSWVRTRTARGRKFPSEPSVFIGMLGAGAPSDRVDGAGPRYAPSPLARSIHSRYRCGRGACRDHRGVGSRRRPPVKTSTHHSVLSGRP